jgi:hypothetical protein
VIAHKIRSSLSAIHKVDIGSLPLVRDWIASAVHNYFDYYVTPKFAVLDVVAILIARRQALVQQLSNMQYSIDNLRQKTRPLMTGNLRTTSSSSISVTSVADKLSSHQTLSTEPLSSLTKASTPSETKEQSLESAKTTLVKPATEVSKKALDQWIAKSDPFVLVTPEHIDALKEDTASGKNKKDFLRADIDKFLSRVEKALNPKRRVLKKKKKKSSPRNPQKPNSS